MDFVADFANADADFGVSATLGAVTVRGILDETPLMDLGMVGGNAPRFHLADALLPTDPRALLLIIGSRVFAVRDWTSDGTGRSTLHLEAQ